MATNLVKHILQENVYHFTSSDGPIFYPYSSGQKFYTTDTNIFYEDIAGERCATLQLKSIEETNDLSLNNYILPTLKGHILIVKYDNSLDYDRYYVEPEDGNLIELRSKNSAGVVSITEILNYTQTNLTVPESYVNLYSTTDFSGAIHQYYFGEQIIPLTSFIVGQINYIVAEFNGGSPRIIVTQDLASINSSDVIPLYTVDKTGTVGSYILHILPWGEWGNGLSDKLNRRLIKTDRFRPESAISLGVGGSTYNTRTIQTGGGRVWYGDTIIDLSSKDSSTDSMWVWYHTDATTWTYVIRTTLPYGTSLMQYDNLVVPYGLRVVQNNTKYVVAWVFRQVSNPLSNIHIVLSNFNDYSLLQAQSSGLSTIPSLLQSQGLLIGRIILNGDGTSAYAESNFDRTFNSSPVLNHNDLSNRDAVNSHPATAILYDNTTSGLTATDVKSALDEVTSEKVQKTTASWIIENEVDDFAIREIDSTKIIVIYKTQSPIAPNSKVEIKAKTTIDELDFGGW